MKTLMATAAIVAVLGYNEYRARKAQRAQQTKPKPSLMDTAKDEVKGVLTSRWAYLWWL